MESPENLFFRVRENGAAVFSVDTENRQRRLEMQQIAVVNTNNGKIKPQGDHKLSPSELSAIEEWLEKRQKTLETRQIDDIMRTIDHISSTAHWVNTKATDNQVSQFSEQLLMAMHDLRSVLVRRMSEQLTKK